MPFVYASELDSPNTAAVFRNAKQIELLDTNTHESRAVIEDRTLPPINFDKSHEMQPAVLVVIDFTKPAEVKKAVDAINLARLPK